MAKCRVLNTVGSLALATVMATGVSMGMGLANAYAAYDETPTLNATSKDTIVKTVKALDDNTVMAGKTKPKYNNDGTWKTYDTWSAYATALEKILDGTTISSAYGVEENGALYTFTVKNADGTEKTYGIKLENSIVDETDTEGTSNSIDELITKYSKDGNKYSITTLDTTTDTITFKVGSTTFYVLNNGAVIGSAIKPDKSDNNYDGDFIGNENSSGSGGAIYSKSSTIGSIIGDFIGNSADKDGGAIYNSSSTIGTITGDFIGNSASYGGAIYTTSSLTFNATKDMEFTDNIASSAYNAIYVEGSGVDLTFTMTGSYSITMNDSVTASTFSTYDVKIIGDTTNTSTGAFYLNDAMTTVDTLTVSGTTLSLGSYLHGNGTTTYGSISTSGVVSFGKNSKLVVDGSIYTEGSGVTAAITGNDTKTFEADASSTLELTNVSSGTYTILDGFATLGNIAWVDKNVTVANAVLTILNTLDTDGTYIVTVEVNNNSEALASVSASSQASMIGILSDANNPAFSKVDSILSDKSIPDAKKGVAAEHAMSGRSAEARTVAYTTTSGAQDVITSQLSSALSNVSAPITVSDASGSGTGSDTGTSTMTASAEIISDAPNSAYLKENGMLGLHVWAMPFYQNHNSDGLKSNSTSTDSENNFGGLVLGLDKTFGDWRVGLAVNAGAGAIKSTSAYATTDTDYDFWGVNLYAGRAFGDFGLTAQLGYSHGDYESYIDQSTAGADSELDMTSHTYAASVRGTYDVATDFAIFTPNLGLTYMHFVLDDCDLTSVADGSKAAKIATDDQDIWTVPFGVTISKDFSHNDWTLTPALDLGGILAMGDLESHAVSRSGAAPAMNIVADVVDDWTFDAGLSLTAVKGVATINLGYDLQVSEHMTNHGVFARIGYRF